VSTVLPVQRFRGLPPELTSFVGRRRELREIKRSFSTARLVTLTGPGGVGKTRLAVRTASELTRAFPEGAWVVELAGLRDPALLAQTVAPAVGLRDQSARWIVATLCDYLADKRMLLVLDNCEHLLDACAVLVDALLRGCPQVRILATSRRPLRIDGEAVFPLSPLSVPQVTDARRPQQLLQYEAVRLLADRGAAVAPGFAVTGENEAAVAALCRRLDGIPLAIELAAVRLRSLAVTEILERLDDRFRLLSEGSRTASPRHRALQAAFDWSYGLLAERERLLWRRASVFAGSFDLEMAEAVCADDALPAQALFELVDSLVDQSILLREPDTVPSRYRLLETIRDHGLDKLRESGEEPVLRQRHREAFGRLAGQAELLGPRQFEWLDRLRLEHDNFRAALASCTSEPGEAAAGLDIASRLWLFWESHLAEGRRWLDILLRLEPDATPARARGLWVAGYLAVMQDDTAAAVPLLEESVDLGRRLGDDATVARAAQFLGRAALFHGELPRAASLTEEALAVNRTSGDRMAAAQALVQLGVIRALQSDLPSAASLLEESVASCRREGERANLSYALWALGLARWLQGESEQAVALEQESLGLKRLFDDPLGIPLCIEVLAWIASSDGSAERAAVLLAAAEAAWDAIPASLPQPFAAFHERGRHEAGRRLGGAAFETARRRGSRMTIDEAVALALEEPVAKRPRTGGRRDPSELTPREHEVASLVAQGLTNREIASKLVISQRTAETHVEHILNKLGFGSRAQVAAWLTERRREPIEASGA